MGCDGGTIPKRHELVKGPKKVEKVDKNAEMIAKWKYCALSQEKLKRPIVACEMGRLYNKDAIIEYLLDKTAERPNAEAVVHIRGIKDIKELVLTDNPEWEGERRNAKGDKYEDNCGMFICPVAGLEMNGKHSLNESEYASLEISEAGVWIWKEISDNDFIIQTRHKREERRFYYLQTCGCVFSERALKEVKTEICHKCGDPFKEEDMIVINGNKAEVEKLKQRMLERREKAKSKKSKKNKAAETASASESKDAAAKQSQESGESSQSAAAGPSGSSKDLTSSTKPSTKRTIQEMEGKSEAFKSLFTTHSSAKRTKDQTSNWVTHTPYHF